MTSKDATAVISEAPPARRWAALVVAVIKAETDPRTLRQWARLSGVSTSTLQSRCQVVGVSAKASLDLARTLRAVVLSGSLECGPGVLLDCDPRTSHRLLAAAGCGGGPQGIGPAAIRTLLHGQRFINNSVAIAAIVQALELDHGSSGASR